MKIQYYQSHLDTSAKEAATQIINAIDGFHKLDDKSLMELHLILLEAIRYLRGEAIMPTIVIKKMKHNMYVNYGERDYLCEISFPQGSSYKKEFHIQYYDEYGMEGVSVNGSVDKSGFIPLNLLPQFLKKRIVRETYEMSIKIFEIED